MSNRPRDWYDMSYDQQREWERNEQKHRRDLEDAEAAHENDLRLARERGEAAGRRIREVASERDEFAEEAGELRQAKFAAERRASKAELFIRGKGLWDEFQATALPGPDEEGSDDE